MNDSVLQGAVGRQAEFRKLPGVDTLLRDPAIAVLGVEFGNEALTGALRDLLAGARAAIAAGEPAPAAGAWPALVQGRLAQDARPSLHPVINATGVIVHTNLGRAPLSAAAVAAVAAVSAGYSNLEYDLAAGARGSRHDHARILLREITGAEDALVVNNNAAAVYLALAGLCQERGVLISRGQLVEIGGGFRIPDVLRQSGARLVEVGTTNRTHLQDFRRVIESAGADRSGGLSGAVLEIAAIMRVHSSNFKQIGFVATPELAELAALAHEHGLLLIDDLGSGTLLDTQAYGLAPEPMVQESLAAGADLVTFSGDKLLGGPQAGLIVGRRDLVERLRRHPLARALRVDKMTLAALDATLRSYRRGQAVEELPVWRMIATPVEMLHERAQSWQNRLLALGVQAELRPGASAVGGGSLPGETLPTWLLALPAPQPDAAAAWLRGWPTPVVARIQKDHLLFDPRTVLAEQEEELLGAIVALANTWKGNERGG